MISKNITKLPKSEVIVSITAPWVDVDPKWNEALNKLAQETEIPGFRKGQAPLNMVESQLGNKLQDEVFKIVFPQFLIEALQGSEIVPIDYPRYQIMSFTKGQQLMFNATITQRPTVTIGDYKNIKAQKPPVKVITEAEVEKLVTDLFNRWKARQPEIRDQRSEVRGQTNGESKSSGSLSFGSSPALPQAPASQPTPTAPDDNFAKAVGALSLEDLKAKLKADLENEAKYNNELDFEEAILQEVEKITSVEIPDILVGDELNRMLVSLQRRVADMGLLMEDYLKGQGESMDSLKNKWRAQAEKNVRMELGLSEIGRMEKVEISEGEVQAEIDKIQDGKLKTQFESQEPRLHLKHSLKQIRTLDLLKGLLKAA